MAKITRTAHRGLRIEHADGAVTDVSMSDGVLLFNGEYRYTEHFMTLISFFDSVEDGGLSVGGVEVTDPAEPGYEWLDGERDF